MMKVKKNNDTIFYVILFNVNKSTLKIMKLILSINKTFFRNVKLKFRHYEKYTELGINSNNHKTLYFIEDKVLLNTIPKINKCNEQIDFVLLMGDKLKANDLKDLKKSIEFNSLNLLGHIPITNNTLGVINYLVLEFIKEKIHAKG